MPTVKEWKDLLSKESDSARLYLNGVELTPEQLQIKLPHVETPTEMPVTNMGLRPNEDNFATLQKLFTDYAKTGTVLNLPSGTFLTSQQLNISSNSFIQGKDTVIKLTDGSSNKKVAFIGKGVNMVKMIGIKLDANIKNTTGTNCPLWVNDDTYNIDLLRCSFAGGRGTGSLTFKGVYSGGKDWIIQGVNIFMCNFSDSGVSSIEMRGLKDFKVRGCRFTSYGLKDKRTQAIQLQSVPCENGDIEGNIFDNTDCDQFAIESAQAMMVNIKIQGNTFNDPKNQGGNGISGYFDKSLFKHNTFIGGIGNHRSGLEIFGSENTIEHNTISSGAIVYAAGKPQRGEKTEFKGKTAIRFNKVKSSGDNSSAFTIAGAEKIGLADMDVRFNTFDASAGKGTNSFAVRLGNYDGRSVIKDTIIQYNELITNQSNSAIKLDAASGANITITENTIKDSHSYINYANDSIDNLIVDKNELINLKQNTPYISGGVKVTKQVKPQ